MTAAVSALDWQDQGACEGMDREMFFPEFDQLVEPKVIATCDGCSVKHLCLQWAIDHEEKGVWGGMTETQREAINRTYTRVRCPACRGTNIITQIKTQFCLGCGLSWMSVS